MEFNELIHYAQDIVRTIDIRNLHKNGIKIDPFNYDFVYGYPLLEILPTINRAEEIFEDKEETINKVSLYVHIPFCTGLCTYCYFIKYEKMDLPFVDSYLDHLEKEIELIRPHIRGKSVHSVYIGGGTPTYLTESQSERLLKFLHKNFDLLPNAEITCEASPETVTLRKLVFLKSLGINRMSIGVETFEDDLLTKINRRHTSGGVLVAIDNIRKAGFENFNVDFMFGLPYQTFEHLHHTLKMVEILQLPSVTFYQLWLRANTPIHLVPKEYFPSEETILLMKAIIYEKMKSLGYIQDKVDWFVKSTEFKYKQEDYKWRNNFFVGLGVSAYAYYNHCYYHNFININEYLESVEKGRLPVEKWGKLNKEDRMRRSLVLGIKLTEGINLSRFRKEYEVDPIFFFNETIEKLLNLGMLKIDDGYLRLTDKGILFGDIVAEEFFSTEAKRIIRLEKSEMNQLVDN